MDDNGLLVFFVFLLGENVLYLCYCLVRNNYVKEKVSVKVIFVGFYEVIYNGRI